MKVKSSSYLKSARPVLKLLLERLLEIYPYASVLAVDAVSFSYSVSKVSTSMTEDGILSNRGFVVKVYDGQAYGEYSFNELAEDKLPDIIENIQKKMNGLNSLSEAISRRTYGMLSDEPCIFEKSTEYEIAPEDMGDEMIIRKLTQLKDEALAYDSRVINAAARFNYQRYSKLFLSKNRDMAQHVMWANGALMMNTQKGQQVKSSYKGFSKLGGAELLEEMRAAIPKIGKNAVDLLDAEPVVPGEYDCICTPDVTGLIAHEAFGHGVEMDMFVKDRAMAKNYIGAYVASPVLTMYDGASISGRPETATYFFDDEGVLASNTRIIKNGVLMTGLSDAQSAMCLKTAPTGNGRRESYRRKAYTRMTNTYFEPGKDKVEDMIASIQYGFLLDEGCSGMEDPKNWGIQLMVNMAREIKDGKLTGRIFSPVVMSGYVPDLLKSITMMSENVELCGSGYCGKGYKEFVKVSAGGPYMKARIRLG